MFARHVSYAALALAFGPIGSVWAAEAEDARASDQLEEITVTAQRRVERLQDVPISVSAFDAASMEARGIRSIDDIAQLTPGLTFVHNDYRNQGAADISIRGIDSTSGAGTTGIYIDDTPIQVRNIGYYSYNIYPQVFDLDRIEVLRGPQGTLFGAGSEGGTVRFITPQPSLTQTSMLARAEIGGTQYGAPSYEAGVAGGGPIINDKLGFRVAAWYREDGGWVDRVNYVDRSVIDSNANAQKAKVLSAALTYAPVDTVRLTPSLFFQSVNIDDTAAYWSASTPPGNLSDPGNGVYSNGNAVPNTSRDKFYLPALKFEWDLPFASLVSNTSYFHREVTAQADYTWFARGVIYGNPFYPPGHEGPVLFNNSQNNITEEIRLQSTAQNARLNWVTGLFFSRASQFSIQRDQDPTLPGDFLAATGIPFSAIFQFPLIDGLYIAQNGPIHSTDKQLALFGQVDYKLTERLKVTAGLRVSRTQFDGDRIDTGPVLGVAPNGTNVFHSTASVKETPVTPKLGLNYAFNKDNMVYASVAKGYRVGGFNGEVGVLCGPELNSLGLNSVPAKFGSDYVWSYEIGSKNTLADGRVQFATSLYYINWKNIQQELFLSSCVQNYVQNLGSATSRGGDFQANVLITEGLTANFAIGINQAKFDQTVFAGAAAAKSAVQKGDHLLGSPFTATVGLQYRFNIGAQRGYARADYAYNARQTGMTAPQDPRNGQYNPYVVDLPKWNYLNLRAGIILGNVDISLFGKNVLNETPLTRQNRITPKADLFQDVEGRPRTYGVTATYRF